MKFSIIIPVYNAEQYLTQCIESILYQTYQNFEIILINDGSTDNSLAICDGYYNKYPSKIKVINKKNEGPLAARIDGIKLSNSDFCVFADADDYIETNLLEMLACYLVKDRELDMIIYAFRYESINKKKAVCIAEHETCWTEETKFKLYELLIKSSSINSIWTKAIRTSILKNDATDYSIFYGKNSAEDLLQLLALITASKKILYLDYPLYNYRILEDSISRSFKYDTIKNKNTMYVYNVILEYLLLWNMNTEENIDRLNARWFNDVIYMFEKYYTCAYTVQEKKKIVRFEWDSMFPKEIDLKNNAYCNEKYKKLYNMMKRCNYLGIEIYFWRKKWYQRIRNWKRKLHS